MGMNPDTNRFENLQQLEAMKEAVENSERAQQADVLAQLVRPNGEPVPKHWSIFRVDEHYVINNYTFRCAYIGETSILLEPVEPVIVGETE